MKIPFIIYADIEFFLEKRDTCHKNPEQFSATKINKHTTSGYSLLMNCSFDATKNNHDYRRGEDCMKNFSKIFKNMQQK